MRIWVGACVCVCMCSKWLQVCCCAGRGALDTHWRKSVMVNHLMDTIFSPKINNASCKVCIWQLLTCVVCLWTWPQVNRGHSWGYHHHRENEWWILEHIVGNAFIHSCYSAYMANSWLHACMHDGNIFTFSRTHPPPASLLCTDEEIRLVFSGIVYVHMCVRARINECQCKSHFILIDVYLWVCKKWRNFLLLLELIFMPSNVTPERVLCTLHGFRDLVLFCLFAHLWIMAWMQI